MSHYKYYSDMMREEKTTFLKFVSKMINSAHQYLHFVNDIEKEDLEKEYAGIHLDFYELDGDGYDNYNVHKWMIEFIPLLEDEIRLTFRGYSIERVDKLFDNEQQKYIHIGDYFSAMDFVTENEWLLSVCDKLSDDEVMARFIWHYDQVDKIKVWTSELKDVTIITEPDNLMEEESY